jgi:hypothetical protein
VKDARGQSILQLAASSRDLSYLRELHGLKKGQAIAAGFVSPLKGDATSMPLLHNKSIVKLKYGPQSCIRIMSIEMNQLRVEARERDKGGYCPIACALYENKTLRVLKRLQVAYPAGVNAQSKNGYTALMASVMSCNVESVDLLLEMGSCPALLTNARFNAFGRTGEGKAYSGYESEVNRLAIIAIFEKHGVTSNDIDATFVSPLYHQSIYFTQRVADANWAQHGTILMCMEEIDIKYRKRGEKALNHLSKKANCFFKVFACVDGTDGLGNGIARLMLAFVGGEGRRAKLTGVPLDPKF